MTPALKGTIKGTLEGYLIKWLRPKKGTLEGCLIKWLRPISRRPFIEDLVLDFSFQYIFLPLYCSKWYSINYNDYLGLAFCVVHICYDSATYQNVIRWLQIYRYLFTPKTSLNVLKPYSENCAQIKCMSFVIWSLFAQLPSICLFRYVI